MKEILEKLEKDDFYEISKRLNSHFSLGRDKKRNKQLDECKDKPDQDTIALFDNHIRYFASSDIASACRKAMGREPYVSAEEMLDDIIGKMKFNVNRHLSLEDKLKRVVKEIVRKEFADAKPEDLKKSLKQTSIDYTDIAEVIYLIEQDDGDIVETMIENLGHSTTMQLISSIIQRTILVFTGQAALRILAAQFIRRNPGLQMLGPIMWVLTGAWLIFDLQNVAYRKTIPICLFIGMKLISQEVAERDRLKQLEDDKYNSLNNQATQKIIKENQALKDQYKQLTKEKEAFKKESERELRVSSKKHSLESERILKEKDELRVRYNKLVIQNSQLKKMGIKKHEFKVGQARGIRDIFPAAIGLEADRIIIQDSYIRGKENELEGLLRQFLNLSIIKPGTNATFITMIKHGEAENVILREMNPKMRALCAKYDLVFGTLRLRRNHEVHSRFFSFENDEMIVENNPDHSFYNLDKNKFAFKTFEEIRFK
ncbi:hypothetical protein [Aliagarivorans marinus]|uniref:hypothetical protein n=1 Tax=Aliagarivorans marinus TaxID=561965 RepID=UPI0004216E40|nr:hypothetical protein [Aliagarivorans marinus]